MTATDDYVANNTRYAASGFGGMLPRRPSRRVAVLACMDSRMDVIALLGLRSGEAHILRNAGGVVTDDMERSLAFSQHVLGTTEVMLVHHTDCGMQAFSEAEFAATLHARTGVVPRWGPDHSFSDVDAGVRVAIADVCRSPFLLHTDAVRGFVYDVATGLLREVDGPAQAPT